LVANPVTPTITTPMFSAARLAPTVAAHSTAPGPAAASSGFGLTDDHPSANARHYAFMLEALRDVQESLTRRGIKFVV
jgi:deoxyribodipyrimidine photolyase